MAWHWIGNKLLSEPWTIADPIHWRIYVALEEDELTLYSMIREMTP